MVFADSHWFEREMPRASAAVRRARPRFLVLAQDAELQYRVLRCAASLGAEIHVAGPARARPLALSRFCTRFHRAKDFAHAPEVELARAIDRIARDHAIDLVMPSDLETTRLLTRIRGRISAKVFPVPEAQAFEALATKDRFMALCRHHGIAHPRGEVFADRAALLAAAAEGRLRLPAVLKPRDGAGGKGVVRVDAGNLAAVAARIDYAPIITQDFIAGEDRSISVFCRDGRVQKEVVYSHPGGVFRFHREPELSLLVRRLVERMRLDGVINFDARIDRDGRAWLVECNPRFFFSMDAIMVAGMNFADAGAAAGPAPKAELKLPRALLKACLHFKRPRLEDWRMLGHWLGDPVMLALAALGLQKR